MSEKSRNTIVKMEEGYMRVSIQYTIPEDRKIIWEMIEKVEKEMDMYPEIFHKRENENLGTFSVEFCGDDYLRDSRESGEFINLLLKKLDITECDNL
jgi:hypothetical protein